MTSFMFLVMHRMTTTTTIPCVKNEVGRTRERGRETAKNAEIDSLTDTQTLSIHILLLLPLRSINSSKQQKEKIYQER